MKLGMIGSFDTTHKAVCGQSDKTELFWQVLQEHLPANNIKFVNSYNWKAHKLKIIFSTLMTMLRSRNVIIMTSVNGTRFLFKLAGIFKKISRKKFYHIVIGGQRNITLLEENPSLLTVAKSLDGIYVEIPRMVEEYRELGIDKVMYVPNGKKIASDILDTPEREQAPYRFCTYSKINQEKGIPEAIAGVLKANNERQIPCTLDVYGVVDPEYQEEFDRELAAHGDCIAFKGKVERKASLSTLSHYYAMLFPTHHPEGVPGAMIDAYEAGLPIIAANSYYMHTIVHDGITGRLVDEYAEDAVVNGIAELVSRPDFVTALRQHCREEAQHYNIDRVIPEMLAHMALR